MSVFASRYTRAELFPVVGEILRFADPDNPTGVSTRRFDQARSPAGHPNCPTANVITYERLAMSWPELKAIALDPKRSVPRTVGRRFTYVRRQPKMSLARVAFALRIVAARLGQNTLSEQGYADERERMLSADLRAYRYGGSLELPTLGQAIRVAGSWSGALDAAGLDQWSRRYRESLAVEQALDRHLAEYGFEPSVLALRAFARARGLRIRSADWDRWSEIIPVWRKDSAARGIVVPPRLKWVKHVDYGEPVAWETTARKKQHWTDEELVAALVTAMKLLRPGEELTTTRYLTIRKRSNLLPAAATFGRGGRPGFIHYRELARLVRQAAPAS